MRVTVFLRKIVPLAAMQTKNSKGRRLFFGKK